MRIYTEVVMQWDENKEEFIEVSSESFNHEGSVGLCASGETWGYDPKYKIRGGKGQPGWQAAGLKETDYKHPGTIQNFGAGYNMFQGLSPQGKTIDANLPSGELKGSTPTRGFNTTSTLGGLKRSANRGNPLGSLISDVFEVAGDVLGGIGASGWGDPDMRRGTTAEALTRDYSQKFAEDWYPQYTEKVFREPGREIQQEHLTELSPTTFPGMPENLFEGYGTPIIHSGSSAEIGGLGSDLVGARGDYTEAMDDIQVEEDRIRLEKAEADKKTNIQRAEFLRGMPSAQEARDASIAKTGMAYSGPAQRAAFIEKGKEEQTLRDITEAKRTGQKTFEQGLTQVKDAREGAFGEYEAAEESFAENLLGTIGEGGSQIQDLLSFVQDLPAASKAYGMGFEEQASGAGSMTDWYRLKNLGQAQSMVGEEGTGAWAAPTSAGYFNEMASGLPQAGFEELQGAQGMLEDADAFSQALSFSGTTLQDIMENIQDPVWTDPDTGEAYEG